MKSTDESIDIMTKTLARMEELMKNVSIQLQRLEEIHGSQAKDVFGKSKERKKEGNLMILIYHCQRPLKL